MHAAEDDKEKQYRQYDHDYGVHGIDVSKVDQNSREDDCNPTEERVANGNPYNKCTQTKCVFHWFCFWFKMQTYIKYHTKVLL